MADVRCAVCAAKLADGAYVCYSCAGKLERRLRDAAALWDDLAITVVPRLTRLGDPTPRAGRPAPAEPIRPDSDPADDRRSGWTTDLPFSELASETAGSVRNTLTTWARVIADGVHADPPTDMDDLTRWVAGRLGWARYEQWAAEMFDELHYAAGLLWQVCDRPIERVDAGLCECGTPLCARPGADTITCQGCGTRWDMARRRTTLLAMARDYRATTVECAKLLTWLGVSTTAAMVRGLAHRNRITGDAWDRYRLGDVEDCRREQLEREARRRAA